MATQLAEALETTASHLHPTPSWDVADHPLPTGREEVWRFTPLRRLSALLRGGASEDALTWRESLPAGASVRLAPPAEARLLAAEAPIDRVSALAADLSGGARVYEVAPGVALDAPLDITATGTGGIVWGHLVVAIGAGSTATVVLRHEGSARYATKLDLLVGDGANVTFVSIQDWADDAVHGGHTAIRVGREASVKTVTVSLGGDLVRLAETARFAGPGGSLEQFGLYFADADQHIEHRLFVDHNAPHTKSLVDFRGALQGQGAHSVWVGDVLIRKVAEGISTYESNKNLVLTEGCRADSVPNLEIETGEIAGAGHSSSTGRFDDAQLFYLMSRGLSEDEARRLVVHGFFADIIRRIGVPEVEKRMLAAVERELAVTVGTPEVRA
jgi:Fe-S cluster assembly protein SufD